MDISLAVAQGFHNAPRLYGDTVRRPNRITGIHSGLRAAGKELTLGVYDGVTGVAVKPYQGAKAGGVPGFFKGVGKAAGGLFFKCNAGIAGLFGFPLKGVHKELRKGQERKVIAYIRDMRIQQGRLELEEILANGDDGDKEEQERLKERVLRGWELQERLEFNKKERDAQLKRDISGVQEIGRGQAKLHSLKKREQKRAKRWKKEALGSDSKEEKKDEDEDREETEEELKKKRVLGTGR